MADPFIAQITQFGGNFAPRAWAFCDGQLLAISSNTALFSLIGCTFGGDCRTTFALPELRGRTMIHPGRGPGLSTYSWGQRGGVETVVLNTTEIPSHTHVASGTTKASFVPPNFATSNNPNGANFGAPVGGTNIYSSDGANLNMAANNVTVSVGNTGGNLSHENRQPWIGIYHIMALQGIFPSRS